MSRAKPTTLRSLKGKECNNGAQQYEEFLHVGWLDWDFILLGLAVYVEFYLYPTVGTVLIHSVKPELTE